MHPLHTLTTMTGREATASRTVVISTFEMGLRTAIVLLVGLVPGAMLTGLLLPFFGAYGLIGLPLVEIAVLFLFNSRSKSGMRQYRWRAMADKRQALDPRTFYLRETPISTSFEDYRSVLVATVPAAEPVRPDRREALVPVARPSRKAVGSDGYINSLPAPASADDETTSTTTGPSAKGGSRKKTKTPGKRAEELTW